MLPSKPQYSAMLKAKAAIAVANDTQRAAPMRFSPSSSDNTPPPMGSQIRIESSDWFSMV